MLGIFGLIVLVLGGFAAGGGLFEWPFLFSDGYRDYSWVRSAGREGARGMLILIGGILVAVGFVAQMVDAAAGVKHDSGRGIGPGRYAQDEESATPDEPSVDAPADGTANSAVTEQPRVAGPSMGKFEQHSTKPAVSAKATDAAAKKTVSDAPAWQPMTVENPEAMAEGDNTLVTVQYRFENDHRRVRGGHYLWVIDVLGAVTEVDYDAETLQDEGQLTHIVRMPPSESGFDRSWSTSIVLEINGRRQAVSNRLEISQGADVRSIPLPQPIR